VGGANNGTTWQIKCSDLAVELIIYELKEDFFVRHIQKKRLGLLWVKSKRNKKNSVDRK